MFLLFELLFHVPMLTHRYNPYSANQMPQPFRDSGTDKCDFLSLFYRPVQLVLRFATALPASCRVKKGPGMLCCQGLSLPGATGHSDSVVHHFRVIIGLRSLAAAKNSSHDLSFEFLGKLRIVLHDLLCRITALRQTGVAVAEP